MTVLGGRSVKSRCLAFGFHGCLSAWLLHGVVHLPWCTTRREKGKQGKTEVECLQLKMPSRSFGPIHDLAPGHTALALLGRHLAGGRRNCFSALTEDIAASFQGLCCSVGGWPSQKMMFLPASQTGLKGWHDD